MTEHNRRMTMVFMDDGMKASLAQSSADRANERLDKIEARLTALEKHLPSARLAPKEDAWPLDTSLEEFELSVRVWNNLHWHDLNTIGDLVEKKPSELLRLPNFGRKSLRELEEVLFHAGHQLNRSAFKR